MPTSAIVKKLLGDKEIVKKKFSLSLKYIRLKLIISLFKWAVIFALLIFLLMFSRASWGQIFSLPGTNYGYESLSPNNLADNFDSWNLGFNSSAGNRDFMFIWLVMAAIFLFIVTPALCFYHLYYLRISNEFLFTDRRILVKKGWIGTNSVSINYGRITDVSISQGVLDRLLRIGSLSISTAGSEGDRISLFHVSHPHTLKKELYDFKEAYLNRRNNGQDHHEVEGINDEDH